MSAVRCVTVQCDVGDFVNSLFAEMQRGELVAGRCQPFSEVEGREAEQYTQLDRLFSYLSTLVEAIGHF